MKHLQSMKTAKALLENMIVMKSPKSLKHLWQITKLFIKKHSTIWSLQNLHYC